MKTLFHWSMFVLLLIGTQLFLGCEKTPKVVPPVVLQPTVELTITPTGTLKYGDNCTISWTSTNANGGVFLNNQSVGTSGGMTKKLFRDTTFILRGVNGSLTATNQKDVKVGDWTTSKFGLVSYYPWKYKAFRVRLKSNGVIVSSYPPEGEEVSKIFYYHKNGDIKTSFSSKIGKWQMDELNENITYDDSIYPKRFDVTLSELILYQDVTYNGQPALFENVYEHASNIPTDK